MSTTLLNFVSNGVFGDLNGKYLGLLSLEKYFKV
jgi:hypothetical protein